MNTNATGRTTRTLFCLDKNMPNKFLGQHFLTDKNILRRIAQTSDLKAGDTIVEIGTGTGTLTRELARTNCKIISLEKDLLLVAKTKKLFAGNPNVTIMHADALTFDISALGLPSYSVIGNIPYYITGRFLRTLVENWPKPHHVTLTVQREVAQRLVDRKRFSKISVFVQLYGDVSLVENIPPGAFSPPPKVVSSIITITPHTSVPPELKQERFKTFVGKGFSSPRKYLTNNLKNLYQIPVLVEAFQKIKIPVQTRPETIPPKMWVTLYRTLEK